MSPAKRPGPDLIEKVNKILEIHEREEQERANVKSQMRELASKVDTISRDMLFSIGGTGDARIREQMIVVNNRLDSHDKDLSNIHEKEKGDKLQRAALWLTILGASLITVAASIVKYLARPEAP